MKRPETPTGAHRRWLYGLWIVLSSLLLTEFIVRVANLAPPLHDPGSWLVEDPVLPYRPQPDSRYQGRTMSDEFDFDYQHNQIGFRDEDHGLDRPAGTFRIVGLGDSYTYGWGADYDETYLRRIETALKSPLSGQLPVEIIKLGIPGFHPRTEHLVWEHHGRSYSPDLVLVAFLPNDIVDTYYDMMELYDGRLVDTINPWTAALMGRPGRWLFFHWESSRLPLTWLARLRGRLAPPHYLDWRRSYEDDGPFEKAWIETEGRLTRLVADIRSTGSEVMLIHIPQDVEAKYQDYAAQRILRWGERSDVAVVDTLPGFRAASRAGAAPLFWEKDGHCTAAGYEVIARRTLEQLKRAEWNLRPRPAAVP